MKDNLFKDRICTISFIVYSSSLPIAPSYSIIVIFSGSHGTQVRLMKLVLGPKCATYPA